MADSFCPFDVRHQLLHSRRCIFRYLVPSCLYFLKGFFKGRIIGGKRGMDQELLHFLQQCLQVFRDPHKFPGLGSIVRIGCRDQFTGSLSAVFQFCQCLFDLLCF